MIKSAFICLMTSIALLLFCQSPLAAIQGRVDIGPALINLDVLQSGKTIESRTLAAIRGDATVIITDGLFVKPSFTLGTRKAKLATGSLALGYCIPIQEKLMLMPQFGYTWTYLHIDIDIDLLGLSGVRERFRSRGPFVGFDFTYKLTDCLTLMGGYQYIWSRTHTVIKKITDDISHSSGPYYTLGLEYRITPQWSFSIGAGYNISLSREKHGLRGKGLKAGIGYYF